MSDTNETNDDDDVDTYRREIYANRRSPRSQRAPCFANDANDNGDDDSTESYATCPTNNSEDDEIDTYRREICANLSYQRSQSAPCFVQVIDGSYEPSSTSFDNVKKAKVTRFQKVRRFFIFCGRKKSK
ncbi:uncharacterized protein LOC128210341 [Mya arenaria]|uniref:uncharacterized protein LOC128210341 n=1 Tax=Mya arenaria TaxID=6604 RepID=UPI0022DF921D|nr:uncharacterized protein LOC128210341 [Mya arenaria]